MKMTILFGTQTGNCQDLAYQVADKGESNGVEVEVLDLAKYSVAQLAGIDHPTLIIISTWDDGVPPPKCVGFVNDLLARTEPLDKLRYTVLAMGDEEYPQFCECGKQVDAKLAGLGAECLMPRKDLGASFIVGFMGWSKSFWKTMAKVYGVAA